MFVEDLSAFWADFGADATIDGTAVRAIFDEAYALGTVGAYGMAGSAPVLTLATASVPASPIGLGVVVGTTNYTIASHEPDGTGLSRLLLEVAA